MNAPISVVDIKANSKANRQSCCLKKSPTIYQVHGLANSEHIFIYALALSHSSLLFKKHIEWSSLAKAIYLFPFLLLINRNWWLESRFDFRR